MAAPRAPRIAIAVIALGAGLYALLRASAPPSEPPAAAPLARPSEPASLADVAPRARAVVGASSSAGARAATGTTSASRFVTGQVVLRGRWGGKPGEFGRHEANESNPEAPAAISVEGGDVIILDQVNARLVRFRGGQPISSITVRDTVQDFRVGPDGRVVTLDRLGDGAVQLHDAQGKPLGELPLAGKGLAEPGLASGVMLDRDGVYVEREHGSVVRIASADGQADPKRAELPGRPSVDGRRATNAAIRDRAAGLVQVVAFDRATLEVAWVAEVPLQKPILGLLMLESDAEGRTYVAADTAREGPEPDFALLDPSIVVVRLSFDGQVTGRIEVPSFSTGDETIRPITIDEQGGVHVMSPGTEGLTVTRYTFP
jgi:hypothetical protein